MRKEKQSMENDMLQQKETIEAFQVRTIPWESNNQIPWILTKGYFSDVVMSLKKQMYRQRFC